MTSRYAYFFALALSFGLLTGRPSEARGQEEFPYTLEQLVRLVESGAFPDERVLELTRQSCLGFRLDAAAARRLRSVGASERLIEGLRGVCVRLTTVVVTPSELEIVAGSNGILRAQALLGPDSIPLPNVMFRWSSEDTTVADVSGGIVVGKTPGETRITATTEDGQTGGAQVTVTAGPAAEEAVLEADSLARSGALELGGKSVGAAAALGVVVPGGGEFYVGNTAKGIVVLVGAAAGLAAGYLITSKEVVDEKLTPTSPPNCDLQQGVCQIGTRNETRIKETRNIVLGAVVAGAFSLYGLIDGIRSARPPRAVPVESEAGGASGLSLQLAPRDGVRLQWDGALELTLVRLRK